MTGDAPERHAELFRGICTRHQKQPWRRTVFMTGLATAILGVRYSMRRSSLLLKDD
ncbi:hypothetical protein [Hyphomicrobium sp. 99]|uniref:hypothetical protein n=1 Tax=Hyphomicrobium sp. 99 TaxID=1163419 RepID=UPI0012E057B6|nr:hypothetical protein [Hyphomicrobium sp. 99]